MATNGELIERDGKMFSVVGRIGKSFCPMMPPAASWKGEIPETVKSMIDDADWEKYFKEVSLAKTTPMYRLQREFWDDSGEPCFEITVLKEENK